MMPGVPGTYVIPSFSNSINRRLEFGCFHGKHKSCRSNANLMVNDVVEGESLEEKDEEPHMSEEDDLAAMVENFIENGGSEDESCDCNAYGNGNGIVTKTENFSESLKDLISNISWEERDVQFKVKALLLRVNEANLIDGEYMLHLLVQQLRRAGYNAAIRKVKWKRSQEIPAGEHEFVDVILETGDRIIIDADFRSQFEIARPIAEYRTAMKFLPRIFVGRAGRLMKILKIMSEAAKISLESRSMHLPPWRTLQYMRAKWFSG